MKRIPPHMIYAALLVILLFALSFFKDHFTPDFLNSPPAQFLAPKYLAGSLRISTLLSHPLFWLLALAYSAAFILLPYLIFRLLYDKKYAAKISLALLGAIAVTYLMVFMQQRPLDFHIIPKLNRYLHSPVITLFLIAAFKLMPPKND